MREVNKYPREFLPRQAQKRIAAIEHNQEYVAKRIEDESTQSIRAEMALMSLDGKHPLGDTFDVWPVLEK
jgi:hypothetical protein